MRREPSLSHLCVILSEAKDLARNACSTRSGFSAGAFLGRRLGGLFRRLAFRFLLCDAPGRRTLWVCLSAEERGFARRGLCGLVRGVPLASGFRRFRARWCRRGFLA